MANIKSAGLRIRVEKDLRDAFTQACHDQNLVASDVLREYMRDFTRRHVSGQATLFAPPPHREAGQRRSA